MDNCILIEVIDREIYTYLYDTVENAWNKVVEEFNEFCIENNLAPGYDCGISDVSLSAWANGSCCCVDWQVVEI